VKKYFVRKIKHLTVRMLKRVDIHLCERERESIWVESNQDMIVIFVTCVLRFATNRRSI